VGEGPERFEGRSGAGSRAYAALGISARSWYAEPWGTEITVPVGRARRAGRRRVA